MPNKSFLPGRKLFKTKEDGHKSAKRMHICISCRHVQPTIFKVCPQCSSKHRMYFPSLSEGRRALQLLTMADAGVITDLEFHPAYDLYVTAPDGECHKICRYLADARFKRDGVLVVEDSKAVNSMFIDPLSKHKIKHAQAQYGITIEIPQRKGYKV